MNADQRVGRVAFTANQSNPESDPSSNAEYTYRVSFVLHGVRGGPEVTQLDRHQPSSDYLLELFSALLSNPDSALYDSSVFELGSLVDSGAGVVFEEWTEPITRPEDHKHLPVEVILIITGVFLFTCVLLLCGIKIIRNKCCRPKQWQPLTGGDPNNPDNSGAFRPGDVELRIPEPPPSVTNSSVNSGSLKSPVSKGLLDDEMDIR